MVGIAETPRNSQTGAEGVTLSATRPSPLLPRFPATQKSAVQSGRYDRPPANTCVIFTLRTGRETLHDRPAALDKLPWTSWRPAWTRGERRAGRAPFQTRLNFRVSRRSARPRIRWACSCKFRSALTRGLVVTESNCGLEHTPASPLPGSNPITDGSKYVPTGRIGAETNGRRLGRVRCLRATEMMRKFTFYRKQVLAERS